jgi:two-component system, LytTR family, sensor kinase
MSWLKQIGYYLWRIVGPIILIALVMGTSDYLSSGQGGNLLGSLKTVSILAFSCGLFCSILLITSFDLIIRVPRPLFYALFTLLTSAGVLLGNVTAFLVLEGRFRLKLNTLIISLLMGLFFSAAISVYFHTRSRLEQKMTRIKEVEIENEKLKRIESEARLNDLRAKLNPHFLFNVLNSTAALIYDDPVKAEQSLVRLSGLYRRLLSISRQDFISVGEELELVEDYLELEKLRFDDQLSFEIVCPGELKEVKIPGLLIEPLVENVIKHNLERSIGAIRVKIGIEEKDDRLLMTVEDDGRGFDVQRAGFGFGLFSIQERLRLIYGDDQAFDIESKTDQGTSVSIRIPKGRP